MCRAIALFALFAIAPAFAQDAAPNVRDLPPDWQAVAPSRLAQMRGGFTIPGGANISFGIERAVYINGTLVVETRAYVPDLSRITTDQAQALSRAIAPLVVRNGAGNTASVSPGAVGTLTIVQNSLDNQRIAGMTALTVGVGSLAQFQALNASGALIDAQLRLASTR
ncbi:Lipoprotein [Lysobacter dokdonensis DS-58]|uniref:Lipoprotein n=1 Tax=Lysobacter dokdonensis DS-58 TaxID=1300345 RepID=A0A0A2WEL7_9GAMM|nr:hypothetical protein [Lysobacter dokdonensis]KGQ18178.1 Lipoprotein [Lysobacter dokdonensis DS-58]